MSIALIADMHGNLTATRAVLADIERRGIKRIFCLGDMVGKGPSSCEVFDLVTGVCEQSVFGNWETLVLKHSGEIGVFFRSQLGEERLEKIRALPEFIHLEFAGKKVKLFHGRTTLPIIIWPSSGEEEYLQALNAGGDDRAQIVGMGDTHHAFMVTFGGRTLLNTGSVGNSCDGNPDASYAILHGLGGGGVSIEHVRLPYDREKEIKLAEGLKGLPSKEAYIEEIRTGYYGR